MEGFELMVWRKERKVTQEKLAEVFGVSRRTVVNWEAGRHRLPVGIKDKLAKLAYTLMPKPVETPPERINRDDFPQLYQPKVRGVMHAIPNEAHPYSLVRGGWLAWPGVTRENVGRRVRGKSSVPDEWKPDVLETEAYKDALRRREAGEPGWPPLTNEERARKINLLKSLQEQQNEEIKNRKNNR